MCLVSFSKNKDYNSLDKIKKFDGLPKWGYIDITNVCNHKCSWCYNGRTHNKIFMRLADFKNILDKFSEIGIFQITITGGEPTLHPEFKEFVKAANKFNLHIASNGDFISYELAIFFADNDVKQVQFNFQGSKFHDKVHQSVGSFVKVCQSIENVRKAGITAVTMTTLGPYLIDYIGEIFREAEALTIDRIRVWDAIGAPANNYWKNIDLATVFEKCRNEANKLEYIYSLSYESLFNADINFYCPQLQNMFISVKSDGRITCCSGDNFDFDNTIIKNAFQINASDLLTEYLAYNKKILQNRGPYCFVRNH